MLRCFASGCAFALAVSVCGLAYGGDFANDGTFSFDPRAVATFDFETSSSDAGADAGGMTTAVDPHALSGTHVLALDAFGSATLDLALPPFARTYRASIWVRDGETIGDVTIGYSANDEEVAALYPTGRVTSDGWIELAADHVPVDGARTDHVQLGLFSPDGGAVDAAEVVPDGEPSAPIDQACSGATDATSCGPGQLCMWSRCRNVAGWVPPIPTDRDDVAAYLASRLELLFGPYLERTYDLPSAEVALDAMRLATDRWSFWNGFLLAVRRMHDGHTTTEGIADFVLDNPRPLSVCFIEGDADLSHAAAPGDSSYLDVLVSHTGADHTLGLNRGDRLVRVDGQHPIAWARSLIGVHWGLSTISNHQTFAELASQLRSLVSRYAHTIDVIRCDAASGTCGAVESIAIGDLPPDPPGTPVDHIACDSRPLRHLADSPPSHAGDSSDSVYMGLLEDSTAVEKIYGMEWESLYTTTGSDGAGAALNAAVSTWKSDGARGVVLDHRTGNGGTNVGPPILWNYAVLKHPDDFYLDRQRAEDEQPSVDEGLATFQQALSDQTVQYAGSVDPVTDVPVALLVTQDVSASDWLALGFKGAPKVKIFGPHATNGAFSTRYVFGYWLSMTYVAAVGDTFVPDGSTRNGHGVDPDVVVLPLQSDLVAGRDTVFETALAWVRQELKP